MTSSTGCSGTMLYEWWDGTNFLSTAPQFAVTPTRTTTYRLVARCSTDFACNDEDTVDVTVHQLPIIAFTETPPAPHCAGDVVTLTAATPDPAATYTWDSGETTQSIQVTASGLPRVTVRDGFGCSRARTFRVELNELPVADAGPDVAGCGAVRIGTPAYPLLDYLWTPQGGLSNPRAAQPWAAVLTPTSYTLTVTDPTTGCTAQDDVLVSAVPLPAVVSDLRVSRAGGMLHFTWEPDPASSTRRVYSELDVRVAGAASERSATAVRRCEGLDSCDAALPPEWLVFYQAVGTCLDGSMEGPN
jgi:hypothetical protein